MINYRKLCEEFEAEPGFTTSKKSFILLLMSVREAREYEKHEEIYYADNEKWQEYWLAIKKEVILFNHDGSLDSKWYKWYDSKTVGCRQLLARLAPIKHQILGRTQ